MSGEFWPSTWLSSKGLRHRVAGMSRYVIIGAGAIGGGLGARLVQSGADVVLVARGDHLRTMQDTGLRLRTPEEDVTLPVTAVASISEVELQADDVVVISTKTHQVLDVLPELADAVVQRADGSVAGLAGDLLPVFLATNGVSAEDLAARYLRRVFGICLWMPAIHLQPGEVVLRAVPTTGVLHLGRVRREAVDDADRALLEQVAEDWRRARFGVTLPEDVMAWKYRKLIGNLGNVVDAVVADAEEARPAVAAADREARQVLTLARIAVIDDETEAAARAEGFSIEAVPGLENVRLGGSTWQSLSRSTGSIETDYLNGEIVRIAHIHGTTAPVNSVLARLGRRAVREGRGPGWLTASELVDLVEAAG